MKTIQNDRRSDQSEMFEDLADPIPGERRFSNRSGYHFHRGKEARRQDRPRQLTDGRYSAEARSEWLAGWDEEDALRARQKRTPEEREASRNRFQKPKAAVAEITGGAS